MQLHKLHTGQGVGNENRKYTLENRKSGGIKLGSSLFWDSTLINQSVLI